MPRPTERSFRVISPPVERQPPRFQFPVLPDRFHTPYPASAPVYLRQAVLRHDADNLFSPPSPEDRITQLPAEIFDMIFSALSVADLDASRYVCHRWWDRIMGSNEVLFNVLHNKSASSARSRSDGSSDSYIGKRDDLRQLARGLDHESSALSTLWLEDSWRSRYRRCRVEFSFFNYFEVEEKACPPEYLKHTFSTARFSSTGNFGLFVVRDAIDLAEAGSQANAVLFYHISWSGRPVYIGSIPGPRDDTVINAVHLSEIEQGRSWMGIVQIGESSLPFSIKLRQVG